jgi:PASTA domain-containing protein
MLDTTNLVFSLVLLQQRRIDRQKALVASVGAALIPGPIGLVVPAIVVGGTRSRPGALPPPDALPPPADTGVVRVKVPDVVGEAEDAAVRRVRNADLTPVTSATFSAPEEDLGQVVDQDPAGGEYARTGSTVDLTIARAPIEDELTDSEKDDEILKVVHEIAENVDRIRKARGRDQGSSGSGSGI